MISDLNLEEKAHKLWHEFSPEGEDSFWQDYEKYLIDAQQQQYNWSKLSLKVGTQTDGTPPTTHTGKAVLAHHQTTSRFYEKRSLFIRFLAKCRSLWTLILIVFIVSFIFKWLILSGLSMALLFLSNFARESNLLELRAHELIIRSVSPETVEHHRFYLKEIDQVSLGFNPFYDKYTLNVKTNRNEKSFAYNLSAKDHQRFYDALRMYKVYVAQWNYPAV
ncbi:hypothetical protein [Microscilla marina]|uniref:Uncharacterized protein n=1 Tax=Microscilla marina ATCC 23134 TaxID=313606 RepID=A1ZCT7_MICM2|nr:hypothetical protein [Microscilla marina]EAY32089.1 hypothetical protein M23134_02118 [Microscilla marina ATCC 23134]